MAYWGSAASLESRPAAALRTGRDHDVRAWRVLHLCRSIRQIAPVLDLQLSTGMQPTALTLEGAAEPAEWLAESGKAGARAMSLFSAWREVRTWRQHIAGNKNDADIVHAHEFPAGMAGVRTDAALVYDVHTFVEEAAASAEQIAARSWLARSFRTAEQFVLSRAGAVVVHSSANYRGALERGVATSNLFLIPHPRSTAEAELQPLWLQTIAEKYHAVYAYVLYQRRMGRGPLLPPGWQPLAACF